METLKLLGDLGETWNSNMRPCRRGTHDHFINLIVKLAFNIRPTRLSCARASRGKGGGSPAAGPSLNGPCVRKHAS